MTDSSQFVNEANQIITDLDALDDHNDNNVTDRDYYAVWGLAKVITITAKTESEATTTRRLATAREMLAELYMEYPNPE